MIHKIHAHQLIQPNKTNLNTKSLPPSPTSKPQTHFQQQNSSPNLSNPSTLSKPSPVHTSNPAAHKSQYPSLSNLHTNQAYQ